MNLTRSRFWTCRCLAILLVLLSFAAASTTVWAYMPPPVPAPELYEEGDPDGNEYLRAGSRDRDAPVYKPPASGEQDRRLSSTGQHSTSETPVVEPRHPVSLERFFSPDIPAWFGSLWHRLFTQ